MPGLRIDAVMECHLSRTIEVFAPPGEEATAGLLQAVVVRCIPLLHWSWGLAPPRRCRIYVVTAWLPFLLHSAPWYALLPYTLLLPVLAVPYRKMWRISGGWTLRLKRRPTVAVKPPRLIEQADRSVGRLLYCEGADSLEKFEHVVCHELTHAFSAHLSLPLWLNEGIAMLAVDRYFGHRTVRSESLDLVGSGRHTRPADYRQLPRMRPEAIARDYARGYWLTRLLAEEHPDVLRALLASKLRQSATERKVGDALELGGHDLWRRVDRLLTTHFGTSLDASSRRAPLTHSTTTS
jgi:hypothetical protein